jgi:thiamine pyrophosphokinase
VQQHSVIVVAGGTSPALANDPETLPEVAAMQESATVIAADGGVDRALALGLRIDVAIGDFDSVTAAGLVLAKASGARIERHPEAKDATDLELALDAAARLGPARVLVVGDDGGRLDHLLASLLLIGSEQYREIELDALFGATKAHVIRGARALAGAPAELISLLPLHGPARDVTTEGLTYPLRGETLLPGSSRGVSNAFAEEIAHIEIAHGVLLAVRPIYPISAERNECS